MKTLILSLIMIVGGLSAVAQDKLSSKDETAIKEVFQMQEDAWNAGDIDQFMKGYWKSEQLVFVEAGGPTYGWQAIRDN